MGNIHYSLSTETTPHTKHFYMNDILEERIGIPQRTLGFVFYCEITMTLCSDITLHYVVNSVWFWTVGLDTVTVHPDQIQTACWLLEHVETPHTVKLVLKTQRRVLVCVLEHAGNMIRSFVNNS